MPSAPTLAATQHLLWRLITAPEGVAAALAWERGQPARRPDAAKLAALPASPPLRASDDISAGLQLEAIVVGNERVSAVERLDVYANMYFYRLLDSLKEDYPALAAVVGDAAFHNLITDYLLAHPPSHPSLRYAGQHLPAFLATHDLAERWPFVPDLARLEWAILDAFDAADSAVLAAADLEALPADEWAVVRFVPSPALQVLELDWDVEDAWERAHDGQAVSPPTRAPTTVQVWRQNLKVFHRRLDDVERDCVHALRAGAPFGEWCERVADRVGEDRAATAVGAVLQRWLREEILVGIA